ncbi:hypothetical protein BJ508DRAFT_326539 [Ascobolus immersus RN42]|uniref:Uncharacterized protein n=1 Tax=Ascobolus immersus RN42 TaxID=1160509 RepID=A0A3N4I7G4_ASCIM|nr:hypothetical protein BJ508DRAFT_326539 [Ascobolus immersus RN42]
MSTQAVEADKRNPDVVRKPTQAVEVDKRDRDEVRKPTTMSKKPTTRSSRGEKADNDVQSRSRQQGPVEVRKPTTMSSRGEKADNDVQEADYEAQEADNKVQSSRGEKADNDVQEADYEAQEADKRGPVVKKPTTMSSRGEEADNRGPGSRQTRSSRGEEADMYNVVQEADYEVQEADNMAANSVKDGPRE